MEFLGVGPLEFIFILVIVLLIFNPKHIAGGARKIGRALNRLYHSESYRAILRTSDELRHLPDRLVEEARIEELEKMAQELRQEGRTITREISASAAALAAETEKLKTAMPDAAAAGAEPNTAAVVSTSPENSPSETAA